MTDPHRWDVKVVQMDNGRWKVVRYITPLVGVTGWTVDTPIGYRSRKRAERKAERVRRAWSARNEFNARRIANRQREDQEIRQAIDIQNANKTPPAVPELLPEGKRE